MNNVVNVTFSGPSALLLPLDIKNAEGTLVFELSNANLFLFGGNCVIQNDGGVVMQYLANDGGTKIIDEAGRFICAQTERVIIDGGHVYFDQDGNAILNTQQAAIPNGADPTVNAILVALRAHGLIAT